MKNNSCARHVLHISDKTVTVYPSPAPDSPVVYLHTFADEGEQVYASLCVAGCRELTLVTISNLTWNHDMTPWAIPPISEHDTPCTGGADEYLCLLAGQIMPQAESLVPGQVLWRGLAGYSLAGLFALYAPCHTEHFTRIASMSGSLWFPGFKEYVFSHEMHKSLQHIYLSLGGRECKTQNPYMQTVQKNTEEISAFYADRGINTKLQLNPGGHFKNTVPRTAAGILWILEQ